MDLKTLLLTMPLGEMKDMYNTYKRKTPEPLTAQFVNRPECEDAIKNQDK